MTARAAPLSPTAAIIVVTYNHAPWIEACLASLTEGPSSAVETVVVDAGSKDDTVARVRAGFPQVRVVEAENRGFGAGNNLGARSTTAPVLVFVNPDTVAQPGFLEAVSRAVEPGVSAAAAVALLRSDPERINTVGLAPHLTGHGLMRHYRRRLHRVRKDPTAPGISGVGFAIARSDYDRLGGFDERIFLYNEDTEFSWRLAKSGLVVRVAWDARLVHDYRRSSSKSKWFHAERSRRILVATHYSRAQRIGYAPSLWVAAALALLRLGPRRFLQARREAKAAAGQPASARLPLASLATRYFPATSTLGTPLAAPLLWVPNLVFLLNTVWWHPWRHQGATRKR